MSAFPPAWVTMWLLCFVLFAVVKWAVWRDAMHPVPISASAPWARQAGFLLAWPGMDARAFLDAARRPEAPHSREWLWAILKTALGATLVWGVARWATSPLVAGWVAMVGLALLLHFGLFHLLALGWRRGGVEAEPIMNAPARATSLAAFWGRRWNLGFSVAARRLVFEPLAARIGPTAAGATVFAISGLVHEIVISVPARAGYGWPLAYFLLQAMAVAVERSPAGRRLGLGRGWKGWLFVVVFVAGPAVLLFHPPFVIHVIVPFLRVIGAR